MFSNTLANEPVVIEPWPCKQLWLPLWLLHLLALLSICYAGIGVFGKFFLLLLWLLGGWYHFFHRSSLAVRRCWYQQHQWFLQDYANCVYKARLLHSSIVTSVVIILHFCLDSEQKVNGYCKRRTVVIPSPMLADAKFRQLRVLLFTFREKNQVSS